MQKEIISFSETDDSDFDNDLLNAPAQEHSAIQEIEQDKEEDSLPEETASAPTWFCKAWRGIPPEYQRHVNDCIDNGYGQPTAGSNHEFPEGICGTLWMAVKRI